MNKLVSKNLSTQFDKQLTSLREKEVEGVPGIHLGIYLARGHLNYIRTYLSQHRLVNWWMEEWTRAWACSVSRNWANSF